MVARLDMAEVSTLCIRAPATSALYIHREGLIAAAPDSLFDAWHLSVRAYAELDRLLLRPLRHVAVIVDDFWGVTAVKVGAVGHGQSVTNVKVCAGSVGNWGCRSKYEHRVGVPRLAPEAYKVEVSIGERPSVMAVTPCGLVK